MPDIMVAPSLLAADFADLKKETDAIRAGGADMLHLDVMDGEFVPNISFGMPVIASLRKKTDIFFDVHIMIIKPERHIEALVKSGADGITFHVEATDDPAGCIELIHSYGIKAGITLKPGTDVKEILPYIKDVDLALIMTVEPGFGGQKFMTDMMPKVKAVSEEAVRLGKKDLIIQIDGGVDKTNSGLCASYGANCLVAGSAVFKKDDYGEAIEDIKAAARA